MPLGFESLAVVFFIASYCQGAPIWDRNKPNGYVERRRKFPWGPRAGPPTSTMKSYKAVRSKDTDTHSNDNGDFLSSPSSFFTWEAFIHGPTGVASSNERSGSFSMTSRKASLWPLLKKRSSKIAGDDDSSSFCFQQEEGRKYRRMKEEEHLIVETSRQFVNSWSDFLCQGSISFGILRCLKEKSKGMKTKTKRKTRWRRQRKITDPTGGIAAANSSTIASSSSLLARFAPFPVRLLDFGKMVESSPSSDGNHEDNRCVKKGLVVLGSWDIPLEGGTLVLEDDQSQEQKSRSSSSSCSSPKYRGKLMFAIAKTTRLPDDQRDDSMKSCRYSNSYHIITGIRDYRPWLAGGGYTSKLKENKTHENIWDAIKDNRETTTRRLCHAFYLSTQSMVHAYVTWRFHHAWRQELAVAVRTTAMSSSNKENN